MADKLSVYALLALLSWNPAWAAGIAGPAKIVMALYRPYVADDDALGNDGLLAIAAHAEPRLKRLISQDRQCEAREGGVCRIDFDPVIAGQDTQLNGQWPVLSVRATQNGAEIVLARFISGGVPMEVDYVFIRAGGSWVIRDVMGAPTNPGGAWDLLHILSAPI